MTENQENLQLTFENEGDHQAVINLQWLRENCYSDAARRTDAQKRITEPHLGEVIYSATCMSSKIFLTKVHSSFP